MKHSPYNQSSQTDSTDPVTRARAQARAHKPAIIAERTPLQVSQIDDAWAKRALTGGTDPDRQDTMLDALPEEKRWDPVPGSTGRQAPESPAEDEDAEGRSTTEQLVDAGAIEAARERQLEAARATARMTRSDDAS